MLGDVVWTAIYAVVSVGFGVGLGLVETGLVDPTQLRERPYDQYAIHYEFLLASFGVLFTAYMVAPTYQGGKLNVPFMVLIVAGVAALVLTAVAGQYLGNDPASFAYGVTRVVLPDLAGLVSLITSVLAAREIARGDDDGDL